MSSPHCPSSPTQEQVKTTTLGYRSFRCAACGRRVTERGGTPFNDVAISTDIVVLVVRWRLRSP